MERLGTVVNGLDIYTFPGIRPEQLVMAEPYPVGPFPVQWEHIRTDLLTELDLASEDVLGRRSACVLIASESGYTGHSVTDISDSFAMALSRVPADEVLYGAMSVASGACAKEKNALPSVSDWDRLAPNLAEASKVCVLQPGDFNLCRVLPASAIDYSYMVKNVPDFRGVTVDQIQIEAIRNTALSVRECEFVAKLRLAGLEAGIEYHLTGSGASIGGPSIALRPGMYRDLDIIALSDLGKAHVVSSFESSAEAFYGPLEKEVKIVSIAGTDKLIEGYKYESRASGITIDFYVGERLEDVVVRPEYLEKGFIYRLS